MVTPVLHCGRDVFEETGEVVTTQYHSLHAKLGTDVQRMAAKDLWRPSRSCKELLPLAWDLSDAQNGPILLGVRHCHKPFWGVQYHPESICTNEAGRKLVSNWWMNTIAWRKANHRVEGAALPCLSLPDVKLSNPSPSGKKGLKKAVQWKVFQAPSHADVAGITSFLRVESDQFQPVLLESGLQDGRPVNAETGRFSVVGLPDVQSIHIRYFVSRGELTLSTASSILATWKCTIPEAFAFLDVFMSERRAGEGPEAVPFWGGLIGLVSYEAGLESINVKPTGMIEERPDIWFVLVERSIVLDHITRKMYLQTIRHDDIDWLCSTERRLYESMHTESATLTDREKAHAEGAVVRSPEEKKYCTKVRMCQDNLRAGSSYELCLTETTLIRSDSEPWSLYFRLRMLNPAPFGAYFNISAPVAKGASTTSELSLLSSSPERFLSWSRDGKCQFRPIKGTVKKCPEMTREKAERILSSAKERAENLMIVDLIRHDLNGVAKYVFPTLSCFPVLCHPCAE
jgi:para-aminobenzoate synthetase